MCVGELLFFSSNTNDYKYQDIRWYIIVGKAEYHLVEVPEIVLGCLLCVSG